MRVGLVATTALLLGGDEVELEVVWARGHASSSSTSPGRLPTTVAAGRRAWRVAIELAGGAPASWARGAFRGGRRGRGRPDRRTWIRPTAGVWLRETLVLGRRERGGRLLNRTASRVGGPPILLEDQLWTRPASA